MCAPRNFVVGLSAGILCDTAAFRSAEHQVHREEQCRAARKLLIGGLDRKRPNRRLEGRRVRVQLVDIKAVLSRKSQIRRSPYISPFLLRNIFTCRKGRASDATGSGASTTRCISRCEAIRFRRAANSRTARSVCSRRSAPLPPEPPPTRHPYRNRSFTAEVQYQNHTVDNHCHID